MQNQFARSALSSKGFSGWIPFKHLQTHTSLPRDAGIYVVYLADAGLPKFLEQSSGGHYKRKDPTVSRDALLENWVGDAEILYIGKGDCLRRRLIQFAKFGAGKPWPHWGGRLIWQVARSEEFLVAWKETPDCAPDKSENALISEFRAIYGKPPFANNPHLRGC